MEKVKASESFAVEKAQAVANFQKLKKFFALCQDFDQELYEEGFNRAEQEFHAAILDHFPIIKLNFLDEEPEGECAGIQVEAHPTEPVTIVLLLSSSLPTWSLLILPRLIMPLSLGLSLPILPPKSSPLLLPSIPMWRLGTKSLHFFFP